MNNHTHTTCMKQFVLKIASARIVKYVLQVIQGVPGGKISIQRGHSIGYSKQNCIVYMCPIPNGFRDRAISLYSSKSVDKNDTTYRF
jgi:hypothetical protein